MEVSNERHRERGRTAGSLEGSTPKAEITEKLTVRNNCGGSRKKKKKNKERKPARWTESKSSVVSRDENKDLGRNQNKWKIINI